MAVQKNSSPDLATALLAWYDRHRRDLPWRSPPGVVPDPYRVWLSEIMLQQTTVATVGPRFATFLARWPDVHALAAAPLDDVLHEWQGLGYYARARNLHACARVVAERHGGEFPRDEAALRDLPGIGAYTAAAIAAVAFDIPATPLDGNIERVVARLFAVEAPLPGAKETIRALAATLTPATRSGDYAQAAMDLGATICTPRRPACALCPWREACRARARGIAEELPRQKPKKAKPQRHGIVFWAVRDDGAVLLRRRPNDGLLGGMMEFPSTPWRETPWIAPEEITKFSPVTGVWRKLPGRVRHGFTHFDLALEVWIGTAPIVNHEGFIAAMPERFADLALPTLMKKVAAHVAQATSRLAAERDRR
ncbi:MAG TPA: A/G-specific adenine glycosylase [Stellaceae bacterium]